MMLSKTAAIQDLSSANPALYQFTFLSLADVTKYWTQLEFTSLYHAPVMSNVMDLDEVLLSLLLSPPFLFSI
jgi:hypothetical protein